MQITQGESIFLDFVYQDGQIPDGYSASCIVMKNKSVVYEKSLDVNEDADAFLLRITSDDTLNFDEGEYSIYVSVQNSSMGYKEYIMHEKLKINGL